MLSRSRGTGIGAAGGKQTTTVTISNPVRLVVDHYTSGRKGDGGVVVEKQSLLLAELAHGLLPLPPPTPRLLLLLPPPKFCH